MSYSGQATVCSQNQYESSTSSCGRESETTDSRTDFSLRYSDALCCQLIVRFTYPLF